MKKTILMGNSGSGKTSLIQCIQKESLLYQKTQMIEHFPGFIDTPGEYLEQRVLTRALIVAAADADLIGFVQACDADTSWLPPSFAGIFAKPVFGIVTKADLAKTDADLSDAKEALECAGAERVFVVSALTELGIEDLVAYLSVD